MRTLLLGTALFLSAAVLHAQPSPIPAATVAKDAGRGERKPQTRPAGKRLPVDPKLIEIDDGDTVYIHWTDKDMEVVRILGIDAPETQHVAHNLPYAQPFGYEAQAFAAGAFAAATSVEILRSATTDPYGRTLGYMFVNGQNYSLLILKAHLAEESVSKYGDNGFPKEAAEMVAAAKEAGTLPFESPAEFRKRMHEMVKEQQVKHPAKAAAAAP